MNYPIDYDTLIVGGGPAGTGLLLKAIKDGAGNKFLDRRIALIEKSPYLIKGNITQYKVNSDTFSDVFLECLEGAASEFIGVNELKNEIDLIKKYKGRSIPLHKLDGYYNKLGHLLQTGLESGKKCEFIMNSCVNKIIQQEDGRYEVFITGKAGSVVTKQIVIATGGIPKSIENVMFAKTASFRDFQNKCIHSDTILKSGLPENIKAELSKKSKVVILGGSHSAFSAAHFLLHSNNIAFGDGDIKIWCNTSPKIYFNSKEDAIAHDYSDFKADDLCPITKKLYRLAGLRMDGRDLYMQMLGLGQSKNEKRVKLNIFINQDSELEKDLRNATLVIAAFGYKLNIFPFFNKDGKEIKFKGEHTGHWVNDHCQLLDENGIVVPNVFASGLATGFIPREDLGGEPSFKGQTNGIWYYQNAIADRIMNNLELKDKRGSRT